MSNHHPRRTRLDVAFGIVSDIIQNRTRKLKIEEERPQRNEAYISEIQKTIEEANQALDSLFSLDNDVIERTIEKYEPVLQEIQKNPWLEVDKFERALDILGTIIGCHAVKIAHERKKPTPDRSLIAASEKVQDEMRNLRNSLYFGDKVSAEQVIKEYGPIARELWNQ